LDSAKRRTAITTNARFSNGVASDLNRRSKSGAQKTHGGWILILGQGKLPLYEVDSFDA
jgi:hypothetical protein